MWWKLHTPDQSLMVRQRVHHHLWE